MVTESNNTDGILDDNVAEGSVSSEYCILEGEVQLDLQSYISAYHGYIYYNRLFFIAKICPTLRVQALRLAHDYIKKETFDTDAYNRIFFTLAEQQAILQGSSGAVFSQDDQHVPRVGQRQDTILIPGAAEFIASGQVLSNAAISVLNSVIVGQNEAGLSYDATWEENTRRQCAILLDQMDTELKNYKANSIKESIRREYDAIGHLYMKMGRLDEARKCYIRTRDYCTSDQQEISMCLNVIKVAILLGQWSQVNARVTRAYGLLQLRERMSSSVAPASVATAASTSRTAASGGASTSASARPSGVRMDSERPSVSVTVGGGSAGQAWVGQCRTALAIASGLVDLSTKNFRGAALKFVQVNPDYLESPTSSLVSQSDLGLLVTLCSLASLDRTELVRDVLGSPAMRLLLETEPVCRDMLQAFHQADYSSLLTRLSPPTSTTTSDTSTTLSSYPDTETSRSVRVSTALRDQLRLDIFLAGRFDQLVKDIRARAMCQYFSPYSSASLTTMAAAFDTTVPELENELTSLIQVGGIKARIDSHKQLLRVVNVDQRCMTYSRVLKLVDDYQKRTQSAILRLSLTRNQLLRQAQHTQ